MIFFQIKHPAISHLLKFGKSESLPCCYFIELILPLKVVSSKWTSPHNWNVMVLTILSKQNIFYRSKKWNLKSFLLLENRWWWNILIFPKGKDHNKCDTIMISHHIGMYIVVIMFFFKMLLCILMLYKFWWKFGGLLLPYAWELITSIKWG